MESRAVGVGRLRSSSSPPEPRSVRSPSPLYHSAFRALWIASIFSHLGTWVQDVGESWLMLSLTRSPLPVALLSTCATLPAFALTLPAGVLADRVDRRRLLIVAQSWLAVVALALAAVTWTGHTSPAALLVASAALGVGSALTSPPWQSLLPDLVPRAQTGDAVVLNAVAFNLARVLGPALGGIVIGAFGAGAAFLVNAASFLAVIEVLRRYERIKAASARAGAVRREESLRAAMIAAFRQVERSRELQRCYAAVAAFGFATSGATALMPSFAKHALGADARGYGVLIGGVGAGAVLAAFVLPRARAALHARTLVAAAMAMYGACALAVSATRHLPLATLLLVPAGIGWLTSFTTLNALVQLNTPAWVKSRVLALYQVSFLGAWALGAAVAGSIATVAGIEHTMTLFALGALFAAAFTAHQGLPAYDVTVTPRGDRASTPPPAGARPG
jgi:MFS family permease